MVEYERVPRENIRRDIVNTTFKEELEHLDHEIEQLYTKLFITKIDYKEDSSADLRRYHSLISRRNQTVRVQKAIETAARNYYGPYYK